MLFIYSWVNMMHCVTNTMCGATHKHCHGHHNGLCGMVVWVDLGQPVQYIDSPRLIFRAKEYNVMNKQTDTVALFSGH